MKTLWLVREPCTILFDVKPIHEALGTDKMDSSVEVSLLDWEYEQYRRALDHFNYWQRTLDRKANGSV